MRRPKKRWRLFTRPTHRWGADPNGSLSLSEHPFVHCALPPHPCPLPQGEGEPFPALEYLARAQALHALAAILPLPEGEGRGEGEGTTPAAQKLRCSPSDSCT